MSEQSISQVSQLKQDFVHRLAQDNPSQNHVQGEPISDGEISSVQDRQAKITLDKKIQNKRISFQVDNDTKEVTIWIVDKSTDKVVMTIPFEAIKDVPVGELLQYTA